MVGECVAHVLVTREDPEPAVGIGPGRPGLSELMLVVPSDRHRTLDGVLVVEGNRER